MISSYSVTDSGNGNLLLTPRVRRFFEKALKINLEEERPFSVADFPEIKPGYFRKLIYEIKDQVEIVIHSKPSFYKIKGVDLLGDWRRVAFRDTGDFESLSEILSSLKDKPLMIHDIKLKINSEIHQTLVSKGATVNESNHGIKVNVSTSNSNFVIKVMVYPKLIQVDVGCSFKPLVYDIPSLNYLQEILKEVSIFLTDISGVLLPPVGDWIITHYHLNKDGSMELNGQKFHLTVNSAATGFIRLYSKEMQDGRVISRLERVDTPQKSISEVMIETISRENHE